MRSLVEQTCVVCGGVERRPVVEVDRWHVSRCTCGTHTLFPSPSEVVLEEFADGSGYDVAFALRDEMVARHHKSLRSVERFIAPGRLLDVGCGPGFLLDAARDRGWEAVGVDPSPFSVARARKEGFEAHEGMLEDLRLQPASFDAVALLQVVEHMTDPRPLLAACRALLKPRGVLLVATPNPGSMLARVKRERFNYWIPPVHCTWYTPSALSRLLSANHFAPVRETTWSARTRSLHDGMDVVANTRLGKRLPMRLHRALGGTLAGAADVLGYGSIVEHIALKWGDA